MSLKYIAACLAIVTASRLSAQTATNWTAEDCSGDSHELFADLNAGKVAVMIWVMPCGTCINEGLMAQTEVQEALAAHPGKVVFYMLDDYANTECDVLELWAASNGISDAFIITDIGVSMKPYGQPGMPKIVVAGGSDHKVFYNKNPPDIDAAGIGEAIAAALASTTGLKSRSADEARVLLARNPASGIARLGLELKSSADVSLDLVNGLGQVVAELHRGGLEAGTHTFSFDTAHLSSGIYYCSVKSGQELHMEKLVIQH